MQSYEFFQTCNFSLILFIISEIIDTCVSLADFLCYNSKNIQADKGGGETEKKNNNLNMVFTFLADTVKCMSKM